MQINLDGPMGWAAGAALAVGAPLAWAWARKNIPEMAARWVGREVRLAMTGAGIQDADLKELLHDVVLCLVRFAEKKIPDEGMGEARLKLVLDMGGRLPVIGAFLKANEDKVRPIIEDAVARMDAEAKLIIRAAAPPPEP